MRQFPPQNCGKVMLRRCARNLKSRSRHSRLRVETLEDRTTPAQFLVKNTNDT